MKIGDREVLSLVEAGKRIGLSANTLRAQIKNGVLPAIKEGNTYFVDVEDLNTYVTTRKGKHGFASPDYPRKPREERP